MRMSHAVGRNIVRRVDSWSGDEVGGDERCMEYGG